MDFYSEVASNNKILEVSDQIINDPSSGSVFHVPTKNLIRLGLGPRTFRAESERARPKRLTLTLFKTPGFGTRFCIDI